MTDYEASELTTEAEGSSLGEAKWNAVKLLEPRFPGVTADCVSFEVLAEGDEEAGVPARVRAELDEEAFERRDGTSDDVRQPARAVGDVAGAFEHGDGEVCGRAPRLHRRRQTRGDAADDDEVVSAQACRLLPGDERACASLN